jgi:UBX domain-containing protein 1/4
MNWLEKTQDTPFDELLAEEEAGVTTAALDDGQVAQSIVCNDCGKKFRSQELAGFHAEKTYVGLAHSISSCLLIDISGTM